MTQASIAMAQQAGDFNLGSTSRCNSNLLSGGQTATIRVAGANKIVQSGTLLTAAEQIALSQVLSTGHQTIKLNGAGIAIGGQFNIESSLITNSGHIRIPQNVIGYIDFSQQSALSLSGNLVNRGTVLAFSTNPLSGTGTINATNILNYSTGLISSVLPASFFAAAQAIPNFNLVLNVSDKITNYGTISSSGALSLIAGNSVINAAQSSAQINHASILSQNNLSVITNNILNSGNLTSFAGNINLQSFTASNLRIDNAKGTISALLGNINVSNLVSSTLSGIELKGGNFISNNLNLVCPAGSISGDVEKVSGWINIEACKANFGASTENLKLGDLKILGDPTFFNSAGSLTLSSLSSTNGFDLALIASHDIVVSGGTIDTTNPAGGNGGNLTILAGVDFTGGTSGNGDTTTMLTLTGPSSTGGAVDLSAVSSINTSGTLTTSNNGGSGGNIFIAAFSGIKSGSLDPGTVNLGTTGFVNTAGGGRGDTNAGNPSGNFTVIAGAKADPTGSAAVALPAIFTRTDPSYSQTGSSGGAVSVYTATPVINGTVTVLNGSLGGSGNITNGTKQNSSISIASTGGGSQISINPSLAQWQLDQMNAALASINAKRAIDAPNLPALKLSTALNTVAMQQAIYLAQTGHLGHFTVQGSSPVDRGKVLGLSSACCAENAGFSSGLTVGSGFDIVNSAMFQESNTPGTHRYNLVGTASNHNNYIGFGFVTVGTDMYFVEEFSRTDPGTAKASIASTPLHGGLGGQAGNVALSPVKAGVNNGVQSVGGTGYLPTSVFAGGDVVLSAGQQITVSGAVIANGAAGIQSNTGGSVDAKNGNNVTVTADGDISLFNIQAGGGSGATTNSAGFGAGGNGGLINVSSTNGNISIQPINSACSPCIAIAAQGGAGGQSLFPGSVGGAGGSGGSVTLSAANGDILLSSIEAGGGGGGGGAGGLAGGGAGGAGGAGGVITLSAKNITVQNYVNASGGGGGGAGGTGVDSAGGGGGGALGIAGFGGASSSVKAGGGGGGGGQVAGFGGPSTAIAYSLETGSNGSNGTKGKGGTAGLIGGGGSGGIGFGGAVSNGGAGGDMGLAGKGVGSALGGSAGSGGTIDLSADNILVMSTVAGFWGKTSTKNGGNSILALGPNGSVAITSTGGVSSTPILNGLADFSSSLATLSVPLGNSFTVGSLFGNNGTFGSVVAGSQSNSITINGVGLSGSIANRSFATSGSGFVTIIENLLPISFNSNSKATPAELLAIEQVLFEGGQTVVLDSSGTAIGGTLTVRSKNVPASGFTFLNVPANLTLIDMMDNLIIMGGAKIDGVLQYTGISGKAVLTTPVLNNSGSFVASSSGVALTVQSPIGQSLSITGTGTYTSPGGISFLGRGGSVAISGNSTIDSPLVSISGRDAVQVQSSSSLNLTNGANLVVTTGAVFNSNGFVGGNQTFNVSPAGSTVGIIANSSGDLMLDKNTLINTGGKNLLLLASGNIISNGLSSINLSNSKGNGGTLTALAGFDFTPTTSGQIVDNNQTLTVTGISSTGGSINLSNTAINTSSSSKTGGAHSGGNILLVANAVTGSSAGVVLTGAINTSSTSGSAGSLSILAPGGIAVGAINAQGAASGGSVDLSAAPFTYGQIQASNGYLLPSATFVRGAVVANGAGVTVNGAINSSSSSGSAGSVNLIADSHVFVSGAIIASARQAAGAVSVSSLNGTLAVNGSINANGLAGTSKTTPGSGASVSVAAPAFVTVTGNIDASGGKAISQGQNGGNGGNVFLHTSNQDDPLNGFYAGNIAVSGYISSAGGDAITKSGGGLGGNAGDVVISAGALQVKGSIGGASILSSGGAGFASSGTNAKILVSTYSVQSVPTNFNLLSTTASEYALPGSLFTTGMGSSVVNGVSGNLVSGSQILNKSIAGSVVSGTTGNVNISVNVGGGSKSVNVSGINVSIDAGTASKRTKVTPALALALYQVSFGNKQTLGITSGNFKQASSSNPQGGDSVISIPSYDLPAVLTSFVLEAKGLKSGITLDVTGSHPILKIPSSSISGTLSFSNSTQAGISAPSLTLLAGSKLEGANAISFNGSKITNSGIINAPSLQLLLPSGAFRFDNLSSGQSNSLSFVLPSGFAPASLSINNNFGGTFNTAINFGDLQLGSAYLPKIGVVTPGSMQTKNTTVNFSLPGGTAHVGGALISSGSLNINTLSAKVGNLTLPTALTMDIGGNLSANSGITIKSTGALALNGTLKAGLLNGSPGISKLSAADVSRVGALSVVAPSINFGSGQTFSSTGANLSLTATSGNINFGSSNVFQSNGGNTIALASGNVGGTTANSFVALSVGTSSKSSGGGIEVGAGTTNSTLPTALSKPPGTVSGSFASFFTVANSAGTSGVVLSNGTVDVGTSVVNQAQLNLSGGAIVFRAQGVSTISLDGANFTVAAFKPIAYTTGETADECKELELKREKSVAHIFIPSAIGSQVLSLREESGAESGAQKYASLSLQRGEFFVSPNIDAQIKTPLAVIYCKKGSLATVSFANSRIRVVNCGSSSGVELSVGGERLVVNAGEEMIVSETRIRDKDFWQSDKIGRRNIKHHSGEQNLFVSTCDVSLFGMLTNLKHFANLRTPKRDFEKRIQQQILKTATALNMVTSSHGVYSVKDEALR